MQGTAEQTKLVMKYGFKTSMTWEPDLIIQLRKHTPGNVALLERANVTGQHGNPLHWNGNMYMVVRIGWDGMSCNYPVIELKELI